MCNYVGNVMSSRKEIIKLPVRRGKYSFVQCSEGMTLDHRLGGVVFEMLKSILNQNTDLTDGVGSNRNARNVDIHTQILEQTLDCVGEEAARQLCSGSRGEARNHFWNEHGSPRKRKMCRTWGSLTTIMFRRKCSAGMTGDTALGTYHKQSSTAIVVYTMYMYSVQRERS